ncbi:hemin-degrading factor [Verminephrobacter eiseniae]|uniref:hemin-degrading factor n=1 Tax=Verminephrobacter eiseniae TaxID=364317 RepID=UPI0010E455A0|nr:ChuX/HutX family heme-like substrate-binding protein [Verminephrobacter eiseniae]KAB7559784.1 hemin-degrading factor [Verminephrobacter sp. Larva24]MCW5230881.1 hemin-degrading factor [Verminephrobacter eiseniae]MCW5292614.1 hemin-degrading factor [Verminephrobacter eiseniae]MCW8187643.1 hemin-degrading factor [Verminephrobacter eiseniae]MCW8225954.1 hemin-degrading factor [Verminephrobacter eiseniae]
MHDSVQTIRNAFSTLRRSSKARHRDIAEQLCLSEGELIAAHAGSASDDPNVILHATRLRPDWSGIMESLEPLGEAMALTRNASCVHEKTGVYRNASHQNHVGLVLGGAIDLRIFYRQWAHGFAVIEQTKPGKPTEPAEPAEQRSLQFFDPEGTAIHKVFLKPGSDVAAYTRLVAHFAASDQSAGICAQTPAARPAELADASIDVTGFHRAWDSLRDTHEFFGLLKTFGLTRTQALRLAEPRYVHKVAADDCQSLLHAAATDGVSIMVFVGNPGMIQIHSGPVKKVAVMGPWLNVLDPGFSLHLREDHIASAWVVKKPTVDGLVTSLELFDAQGDTMALFFGERKPGQRELCEWRALIENLQPEPRQCAA